DAAMGTVTYTPDPNFHGEDTFTFETCDPDGACDSATVTIRVEEVDNLPVADKQEVNTPEDTAIAIQVTGSDVDGEALTYGIVSGPSRGTISGFDETTGELIYTPESHTGTDGFVFDVSDSHVAHGRPQATVTIMVTPVNDTPVARNQTRATSEDTATGFFRLAIEDPDNTLAELECDCVEPPQHGSIERGPDHTVNYTPNPNYMGTDTFTYIVCDPDGLCDTATVTVTISATNDNPSVSASDQTTPEDTAIDIPVTHSDPDGDRLTCTRSDPAHGTVSPQSGTMNGPYPMTETLTYTPEADFVGVDQIVMQCDDGNGGSDSVTIEITVTAVNDRPEANDGPVTMPEDTSATITMTGSDPDLDVLSFEVVGGPSHGTITGLDGATTGPDGCGSCHTAGSSLVWATGGVSAEHLTYTPAQDYYGTDEIIFQTCDPSGACDTGVVTIVVESADDNPIPDPQAVTTPEDVAKGIVLTAVEPDGETLTYEIVSSPSHGTIAGFDEDTGELIYVPDENYVGTDSLVFEACDPDAEHGCPQATVTITVTSVNDPPNAAADTVEITYEDTALPIIIPGTDVDGDNLVFSILSGPSNGSINSLDPLTGSYIYIPNADFNGIDELIYEICDPSGACDQGFVHIDVLPVNDEPVAQSADRNTFQDTPIDVQLTAGDPETPDLVFTLALSPRHGTLLNWDETTGEVRYQPESGYVGSDSFLFRVCDPNGACDTALVSIDVIDVNDPPRGAYLQTTVNQGEPTLLAARATDPDGEPLTFSLVSQPVHGSVILFYHNTGRFIYVSDDDYVGPDLVRFEVCDASGACDIGVVQLNVVPAGGGGAVEACPNVVISEIAWAGTAAGVDEEWIELRNLESMPVELEGWFLRWRNIFATESEDRAWRVLPLTGSLGAYQEDAIVSFELNPTLSNSWWIRWTTAPSPDHFIAERGDDETTLPIVADQIYPMEDEFGLLTRLPDEVAVVELIGPSGCLVDTANIDWPHTVGWPAGSAASPASMERTDLFAEDGLENWHSSLGLVRAGFDAFGNLLHGTPGAANSPIMAQAIQDLDYGPTSHPMGEPIVIPFEDRPLWSDDSLLWHVVVTQGINDDVLPAEWDVIKQEDGSIAVIIRTNKLPLNTTLYVWVRTPAADVLFVPYVMYPY
ncbi:Ig-like domain-containing protein, partial [Candidatus Bipolaricaulota bacterium]